MEGLLLVDKPAGWTSFDVVNYVRGVVSRASVQPGKKVKVGHSGTLDPFATGLLILLVGKAYTSQSERLLKQDKSYQAIIELGRTSTTGDPEGELSPLKENLPRPNSERLLKALNTFKGDILQTPPAFSAIKVSGVRAYKLARDNRPVELKPRKVSIKSIELISYAYPLAEIQTTVSSGTYIRSLVEDIGSELGLGAYTKNLRRLTVGSYSIEQASQIEQITEHTIASLLGKLSLA
ncbi:MAG: tRNA pseudouridine(55) synthase TruB [Candidatus Saccharimonadales bacterium]